MKIYLALVLLLTGIINSQNLPVNIGQAKRTCGTMQYLEMQKAADPGLESKMNKIEQQVRNWIRDQENQKSIKNLKLKSPVITIPVVFHVLWNSSAENISDAQILSQIDVLNEDFGKLNTDASNVPDEFKDISADAQIKFCLAMRDPFGNPTNGITRTNTTVTDFSISGDPKYDSQGGKDAWPRDDYLNFWVCDLGSGLLGYATFPGGSASEDGIVCTYYSIGRTPENPFGVPFDLGRTATHEIGHWIGLYHTFEGGCTGTSSATCSTGGDRICDTPPTSSANYGCPSIQNTCTETPVDYNDQTMNYMDYADDACMFMFSQGQADVMNAVLNTSRSSIQSSLGCEPPVLPFLDAGIYNILSPEGIGCADSINPVITLKNFGSNTLTSVMINYQIDTNSVNTYSWTGNIITNDTVNINLPAIPITFGEHIFKAYTTNPNGGIDTLVFNNAHIHHIKCIAQTDAGVVKIISPIDLSCPDSIKPIVSLINAGIQNLTSVTINYQIDTGMINTHLWTGNLVTNATGIVTLTSIAISLGPHTITIFTSNPNGVTDGDTSNDQAISSFTIITAQAGIILPLSESFEGTFPPSGWTINNPTGGFSWMRTTSASSNGTVSIRMVNYFYNDPGAYDELVIPAIDLISVTSPILTFTHAYTLRDSTGGSDTLEVLISTDCGGQFTSIYKKYGVDLTTTSPYYKSTMFTPDNTEWMIDSIDLSSYTSFNNLIIKFRNINGNANNLYLDNINIGILTDISNSKFTENPIRLFPNPTTGDIFVDVDLLQTADLNIKVYNILGKVVYRSDANSFTKGKFKINLNDQPNGLYFAEIVVHDLFRNIEPEAKDDFIMRKIVLVR